MAENNNNKTPLAVPDAPSPEETAPTRLEVVVTKYPKIARVVAITSAVTAVVGAAHITRTVSSRRAHLNEAADHAKEALRDLSASVSPTDPEA